MSKNVTRSSRRSLGNLNDEVVRWSNVGSIYFVGLITAGAIDNPVGLKVENQRIGHETFVARVRVWL